jgi:hypothetical protein
VIKYEYKFNLERDASMNFNDRAKIYLSNGELNPLFEEKENEFLIGSAEKILYTVKLEEKLDEFLKMKYGDKTIGFTCEYPDSQFQIDYCAYVEKDNLCAIATVETDDIFEGVINSSVENLSKDKVAGNWSDEFNIFARDVLLFVISYIKELTDYRLHFSTTSIKINIPTILK